MLKFLANRPYLELAAVVAISCSIISCAQFPMSISGPSESAASVNDLSPTATAPKQTQAVYPTDIHPIAAVGAMRAAPAPSTPKIVSLAGPPAAKQARKEAHRQVLLRPNLWHRVRQNMQWSEPLHERTKKQLAWFVKNPDYIRRVIERGTPYLHYIVNELEKNQLPAELALLPIIESAYRPFAYSFGRATGLWQFIPSTGKAFGLRQDWWYDGRRDVVASTDAAIRFFKQLKSKFSGDWLHALAAYNAGPAKIRRAIRRNKKNGLPTEYWDLQLPRETHYYVPKLLGVVELVRYPDRYGVDLPVVDDVPYFARVDTEKQIDLARAAKLAQVDIEQLYLLNPGFNRWATAPDGPHRLLVPVNRAEAFSQALEKMPDSERIAWRRHSIQPGDTLSTIAERYNTNVAYLKQVNRIRGHIIQAGQALMIPGPGENHETYALSADQRLKKTQLRGNGRQHVHKVAPGDTLWDLAKTYQASIKNIARWNGITPKTPLRLGQKLVIWQPANNESQSSQTTAGEFQKVALRHVQQTIRYTVRNGDSLDRIANRFNIRVSDLIRWNSELKNAKYIHPGQKLRVRLDVRHQSG